MADSFNVTPGSGIQLATREVDSKHYQKVSGDLIYFEGTQYLGGGTGNVLYDETAVGGLLTEVIELQNVALESGGATGNDNGLVEVVDIDLITNIRFFDGSDANDCKLGVVLLNGGVNTSSGNTFTINDPIAIQNSDMVNVLGILTLYPVSLAPIGGLYNYTFQVRSGRHRTFISTRGSTKNIKAAFINHTAVTWNASNEVKAEHATNANPMYYRFTFDRTMI